MQFLSSSSASRLFNYGVGIHLLKDPAASDVYSHERKEINPRADHLSFQVSFRPLPLSSSSEKLSLSFGP